MLNKIIVIAMFFFLLIAISIKLIDPSITYVSLGEPFMSYLKVCSDELNRFKIAIPDIPKINIDDIVDANDSNDFLNFFKGFARGFFQFVNIITTFLNIVADILNVLISLVQFFAIMIKNIKLLRDNLVNNSDSVPSLIRTLTR